MEREGKPTREINLQSAPVTHTCMDICNTPGNSNIKEEPEFHGNGDAVKFSEHMKYGGNVANIMDINTAETGDDDCHSGNLNNTHSDHTIGDQIPGMIVAAIKAEPDDETNVTNEVVIEIDTCTDEYYEKYEYPTNCANANVHNSEQNGGRMLCAIDTVPCSVGLIDIRNAYPDIITQRSVHIHSAGLTSVIDEPSEAPVTKVTNVTKSNKSGASFPSKSNLNSHTLIHTGEQPHKCPVCGVTFTQKGHMKTHTRIHTGEKPYKCSVCEISFAHSSSLTRHTQTHTGEKPYKCSVCRVGFTQKSTLTTHTRIHTGAKPHKCYVCDVSFTEKCSLTRHMLYHTGERPYKCSLCEVRFTMKHHLESHMRTHTGDKPFKCPVCGVGFARNSNLTTHMRIHTGEKPHTCYVCQRSFTTKDNLTKHIRTHTNVKPYKCSVCGVAFAQQCNLVSHIRAHGGRNNANVLSAGLESRRHVP